MPRHVLEPDQAWTAREAAAGRPGRAGAVRIARQEGAGGGARAGEGARRVALFGRLDDVVAAHRRLRRRGGRGGGGRVDRRCRRGGGGARTAVGAAGVTAARLRPDRGRRLAHRGIALDTAANAGRGRAAAGDEGWSTA